MTPEERAALRKIAQAATEGEWRHNKVQFTDGHDHITATIGGGVKSLAFGLYRSDAAFIAAANPATVLRLLDQIAELERGITRVTEASEPHAFPDSLDPYEEGYARGYNIARDRIRCILDQPE